MGLLRRSLYGLKQAGRLWNRSITDALKQLGYEPTQAKSCLFVIDPFILLYVNGMLIVTNGNKEYERVWKHHVFSWSHVWVMSVTTYAFVLSGRHASFLLSRKSYIERILTFGMEKAKPSSFPMDPGYVTAEQKEEKVMSRS